MPSVMNSKWRPKTRYRSIVHTSIDSHFVRRWMRELEKHCAKENSFLDSPVLRCALTLGNLRPTYVGREDRYE